jgi:ribosomal protein S6
MEHIRKTHWYRVEIVCDGSALQLLNNHIRIIEELSHIEIVREEEIETHTEDHQSQEQS